MTVGAHGPRLKQVRQYYLLRTCGYRLRLPLPIYPPLPKMPARQARYWIFVDHTMKITMEIFKDCDVVRYAQWQHERGGETNKDHYQGWFQLKEKKTAAWLTKNLLKGPHYEPTKADAEAQKNYCTKTETYVDGPWEYGTKETDQGRRTDLEIFAESVVKVGAKRTIEAYPHAMLACGHKLFMLEAIVRPPKPDLPEIQLYEWQQKVIEILQQPVAKREIIWIWSEFTGKGKSTFYDYVAYHYRVLKGSMEMKRTLYAYDDHQVIWFDVPRQTPLDAEFTSQLEALANQTTHLSSMFAPVMKLVKAKLVVTCNRPPPEDKLPGRLISFCVD